MKLKLCRQRLVVVHTVCWTCEQNMQSERLVTLQTYQAASESREVRTCSCFIEGFWEANLWVLGLCALSNSFQFQTLLCLLALQEAGLNGRDGLLIPIMIQGDDLYPSSKYNSRFFSHRILSSMTVAEVQEAHPHPNP